MTKAAEKDARKPGRPKGSMDTQPRGGRKLVVADVIEIRRLFDVEMLDLSEIRIHYPNVSRQNIEHIVKRRTWKSVK